MARRSCDGTAFPSAAIARTLTHSPTHTHTRVCVTLILTKGLLVKWLVRDLRTSHFQITDTDLCDCYGDTSRLSALRHENVRVFQSTCFLLVLSALVRVPTRYCCMVRWNKVAFMWRYYVQRTSVSSGKHLSPAVEMVDCILHFWVATTFFKHKTIGQANDWTVESKKKAVARTKWFERTPFMLSTIQTGWDKSCDRPETSKTIRVFFALSKSEHRRHADRTRMLAHIWKYGDKFKLVLIKRSIALLSNSMIRLCDDSKRWMVINESHAVRYNHTDGGRNVHSTERINKTSAVVCSFFCEMRWHSHAFGRMSLKTRKLAATFSDQMFESQFVFLYWCIHCILDNEHDEN